MVTTLPRHDPNRLQPSMFVEDARAMPMEFEPNLTLAKGTVLGIVTASGKAAAYNNALATGVETAVGILQYDIATDANGQVYLGDTAVASIENQPLGVISEVWIIGTFKTADLTGYDAAAGVDLGAKTVPGGHIRLT